MKKYLLVIIIILLGVCLAMGYLLKKEKTETKRLTGNQSALLTEVKSYKTKDSLSAASVQRLVLSKGEIEKYCGDLENTLSDLNIKIKRLQSASTTAVKTEYIIKTVFRDSIVFREKQPPDTIRCVQYEDPYLTFSGCDDDGDFTQKIESRDTIETIVHRVPNKWWFIKWGTKGIQQDVVSKNPHSKIVFTRYIELK